MKFDTEESISRSGSFRIVLGCLTSLFAVCFILGAVLFVNRDKLSKNRENDEAKSVVKTEEEFAAEEAANVSSNGIVSDDLDFWGMYDEEEKLIPPVDTYFPEEEKHTELSASQNTISANSVSGDSLYIDGIKARKGNGEEFEIVSDGKTEKVKTNQELALNNFSAPCFKCKDHRLDYFNNNRKTSTFGIDVSKYQGAVDWETVKKQGVEFAMIRMGVRGYSSGSVVLDEDFSDNIVGAVANGIQVGIYFYSQAINTNEAIEEANYAVAAMQPYNQKFPIVFYSEEIVNDSSRTDSLGSKELTDCAVAFCDTVKSYGFKPMIAGSKKQLVSRMDIDRISAYDLWLLEPIPMEEEADLQLSDFPYQYAMWQYECNSEMKGVRENVNLDICFVDFAYR